MPFLPPFMPGDKFYKFEEAFFLQESLLGILFESLIPRLLKVVGQFRLRLLLV